MNEVVWVVSLNVMVDDSSGLLVYPERVFKTEDAAEKYMVRKNPVHPCGFTYRCPAEGTYEYHSYSAEPIIYEEE